MITRLVNEHVTEHQILSTNQKALRRGRRGCMDALWADFVIASENTKARKSLSVAWVDYTKGFDRVPHGWIRYVLKIVKMPRTLRRCVRKLIPLWRIRTDQIPARLFQGDYYHLSCSASAQHRSPGPTKKNLESKSRITHDTHAFHRRSESICTLPRCIKTNAAISWGSVRIHRHEIEH